MGGDFVIGIIVFMILVTVNFLVITKGATRIAEVGARFTLDAIPGKQMAIDADLSAGLIDDKEAQRRRRELEEESAFFGSMDGASKFVRGDAIAGLIITAVNIFGGIIIGVTRHDMSLGDAADVFTKLSVGDGLVTQIPALIVSLAAGLLVSKGGTRGSADQAVFGQLGNYPRALPWRPRCSSCWPRARPAVVAVPHCRGMLAFSATSSPGAARLAAEAGTGRRSRAARPRGSRATRSRNQLKNGRDRALPRQAALGQSLVPAPAELARRVAQDAPQIRHAIRLRRAGDQALRRSHDPARRATRSRSTAPVVASAGDYASATAWSSSATAARPDVPGDDAREPAFGMKALWVPEAFAATVRRAGFTPVDNMSRAAHASCAKSSATISRSSSPTRTCARCSIASSPNTSA